MLLSQIDKKLLEIYENQRENEKDRTGWEYIQELKKEADNNLFLFSFFVYRSFELVFEKKKELINLPHMIKELLRTFYHYEHFIPKAAGSSTEDEIELFPGIIFAKGITYKILEHLKLEETKVSFSYYLMIWEEEINEKKYLSEDQIRRFKSIERIIEVFLDEYNKKLKNKPRIIKI